MLVGVVTNRLALAHCVCGCAGHTCGAPCCVGHTEGVFPGGCGGCGCDGMAWGKSLRSASDADAAGNMGAASLTCTDAALSGVAHATCAEFVAWAEPGGDSEGAVVTLPSVLSRP